MPAISKIRFTNIIYENGEKRFNDDIFEFDGHNGVILLANGGGKTVFIQTALQAVLPHVTLGGRKIRDTLSLEGGASHIAIEWILNDRPRRYALTAVTLFLGPDGLKSFRYAYDYSAGDDNSIENIPFIKKNKEGDTRPASRHEIQEYYQQMQNNKLNAHTFDTIKTFQQYIEENFHIINSEWKSIERINGAEGDVEKFFENAKTASQLVDQLLIPVVEETLVGNGTEDFVQIFERQREHFKKHQELREKIKESKNIEERISHYVTLYTKLHQVEEEMLNKKRKSKSIYEFLEAEKEKTENEIAHVEELKDLLQKDKHELRRKKASYKLAMLNKELEETKDDYEIIKSEYMGIDSRLKEKEEYLQNLEIAELKSTKKQSEEKILILKKQLEELEKDKDIMDLKNKLEENSSILKGYFEREKENLEKQKEIWKNERNSYKEEVQKIQQKINNLQMEKENLIEERAVYNTKIDNIEDNMKRIRKDILANVTNETIEGEYPKWKERAEEIEKLNIKTNENLSKLVNRKESISKEIEKINHKIQNLIKETAVKEKDLNLVEKEHGKVLNIVKELRLEWHYLDSIYLKRQSIIQYMEERLEKVKKERERLLEKERLSYRLLDYYGENEYFIGEPLLEEWIHSWKNQFHLLEIGSRYIEKTTPNLNKDINDVYTEYPLWTLAVITTEGEVDKLTKKLEEQRKRITFPILILSQKEATSILLGKGKIEERYVYPFIWKENIDRGKFKLWKAELKESAKKAVENRKNKEREEEHWQHILNMTKEFFSDYPYDMYAELSEEYKNLKNELDENKSTLDERQKEMIIADKEIKEYETKLKDLEQESIYIGGKIEKALYYFEISKEKEKLNIELYKTNNKLSTVQKGISSNEKSRKNKSSIIKEIDKSISSIDNQISMILRDPHYREVKSFNAIYSEKNLDNILEEREYVKDVLSKKQKGRAEIEGRLKDVEVAKEKDEEQLNRKYKGAKYPIDKNMECPYNVKELIQGLLESIKKINDEIEKLLPNLRQKERIYEKKNNTYENRLEDFHKEFEEVLYFTQPLPTVKEKLSVERVELEEKQNYLDTSYENLRKELKDIQDNIQNMNIKNGKYEFLLEGVETETLSSDIKQNLPYNRKKVISGIMDDMESLTKDLEIQIEKVDLKRNQFIMYLNNDVKDIRLRQMAVSGIRNKKIYQEVLDWQRNMDKTLDRVIRIHEKNMMEHDKELNQFIQYLNTYLSTLADEIRTIPKNTRVKIDDTWKEIFQIQVPIWEEEEGKEEIRKHVDWMINKLETDEFLDDDGREENRKIREAIRKWLQSKQLLNIIMGGKEIKVKCRKVTNDGKVSNMYYSWRSSNQWSGGEKWSKNMALFLGILNYTAEKKQHIVDNQKRHGTVIMDNPFGKASSDHVLSPVFFIAEQLGFQFIALTAHGEGRFIRDYFPVVYSCKLRPSVEGDTSILTKKKNINYAFLKIKSKGVRLD